MYPPSTRGIEIKVISLFSNIEVRPNLIFRVLVHNSTHKIRREKKMLSSSNDKKRRHVPPWGGGRRALYEAPDLRYYLEGGREKCEENILDKIANKIYVICIILARISCRDVFLPARPSCGGEAPAHGLTILTNHQA